MIITVDILIDFELINLENCLRFYLFFIKKKERKKEAHLKIPGHHISFHKKIKIIALSVGQQTVLLLDFINIIPSVQKISTKIYLHTPH